LLIQTGLREGRLTFSSDLATCATGAQVFWVTIDTPVDDDDQADVEGVIQRVEAVLPHLGDQTVVLVSSQLPVGSIARLEAFSRQAAPDRQLEFACIPENLRLGKALDAFLQPDRVVVGVREQRAREVIERLLTPWKPRVEWMTVESAEMTKHAINAFLATSVTWANEIAVLCEMVGADAKEVERGLKTESRIGARAYVSPGGPFAGGTLARDVAYLSLQAQAHGISTPLLASVSRSNDEHKLWARRQLLNRINSLTGARVALWGLTYKPGTSTLRRSWAVELCDWLLAQGAFVSVYDPAARELPERWSGRINVGASALEAASDAQVLVVGTEWAELKPAAQALGEGLCKPLTVLDPNRFLQAHFTSTKVTYVAVGMPTGSQP
jgi:UDPglucose 6-dehydrogenase